MPHVVDAMLKVPDPVSIAAMRVLSRLLGRRVGASTGTNFIGVLWAAQQMSQTGKQGSIVTLICDSGERYAKTYFDDAWLSSQGIDIAQAMSAIDTVLDTGKFNTDLLLGASRRNS